ncbi:aspartyl-phosphate phosphatase Spo0E family protein [Clostridium sp.]|uniref:aspartyl-phosphate phosphatase Spo0E family protein n=1 Tax=Clostridium sp. TaxID=1506 RepID=UPI00284C69CF|nr:aspartyl-phosphate phosphatase Spo0E family protein [Clostridium sp.]MDR3596804.1 aspartyl-phosphate phosphatase Spo0E family protein [Clostridium sp.]
MGENNIEKLRAKLNKAIEAYGRDSPKVLKISQQLDLYIVEEMKEMGNKNVKKQ